LRTPVIIQRIELEIENLQNHPAGSFDYYLEESKLPFLAKSSAKDKYG
jgi:hypothetical protein